MATPKLEYIEELVINSFSDDLKQTLNFTLNENNVVIIKIQRLKVWIFNGIFQ